MNNKNKNPFNKIKNATKNAAKNAAQMIQSTPEPNLTTKVTEIAKGAMNKASNLGQKIGQVATNIKDTVQTKITTTTDAVKAAPATQKTTEQVSKVTSMTKEFMQANSAISKFVAVVLSILLFYILFNIGVYYLNQYFMPGNKPQIVDGLIDSNTQMVVSSNPNVLNAAPILRSVNQSQGLEFTWDVWFFIKDVENLIKNNNYSLLFSKGIASQSGNSRQLITSTDDLLNVCPGAYISYKGDKQGQAQLTIAMNTYTDPAIGNSGSETVMIPDIPLNKWVHLAIRVQSKSVDIYINGVLTQRHNLQTLPKQNYYDTYVGDPQGFNGFISSLNYYNYALNYDQIQSDYVKGPNMVMKGTNTKINYKDYLAMNWYYNA
jgi:hypothetical protein